MPCREHSVVGVLNAIGGGGLADTSEALARRISDMLADHAAGWRSMKHALIRHGRNSGAIAAAYAATDSGTETLRGGNDCTAAAIARMCAGVVPQQPPTTLTKPLRAKSSISRAVSAGVSS